MRTIRIFAYFLYLMLVNLFRLSDDVDRNYIITKKISSKTLSSAGITVERIGHENIPAEAAVVIAPNHKSLFDIMAMIHVVDRTMGVVTAKEMYIPVLRKYIDAIKCVRMDRFINTPVDKKEVLLTQQRIVELLNNGYCLTIFPEGRLIPGADLGEFKTASFKAPLKTDSLIVPAYISGSEGINKRGKWFYFPKNVHITVTFGKPIRPSELGAKGTSELSDAVKLAIAEKMGVS